MMARELLSLLRLASPALPLGGFSYSRGLEAAVAAGWVHDEGSVRAWMHGVLEDAVCPLDGAVLCRLHDAFARQDADSVLRWSAFLRASRESAELLLEDEQMGRALLRLLQSSAGAQQIPDTARATPGFTSMFALAAVLWGIGREHALLGYLFTCADSQVSAALRLLPLGQTAGQRLLECALPVIERCSDRALALGDDEIGTFTPGLALASAWHEQQYSRLFRS